MKKMKSIILSLAFCALCAGASAQTVSVGDVEALPGETVAFTLDLTDGKADTYIALQFDVQFPATGFTTTGDYSVSSLWKNASSVIGSVDADGIATIPVSSSEAISSADVNGLLTVSFTVGSDVAIGDYDVTLKNLWFGYGTSSKDYLDNVAFQVHVVATHTITLDENATTAPEAGTEPINVLLNRTIKANQWSTICLPFAATGEQVKAAFGNDVELSEFTGWESEEDDGGAIVAINVTFTSADLENGIEANTPMLIRVSKDITTPLSFEGITLEPEDEPVVQVGKKASQRGYFHGTYAVTKVPAENLFISDDKFYYSVGKTPIKGYRGYFEFRDVLDAYYDVASVKFNLCIDGEETRIDDIGMEDLRMDNGIIFNLAGQRVGKSQQKGVYIVNGKKVLVK